MTRCLVLCAALCTLILPPSAEVADEAFCSRPAERALDLLGDLAFERGDFDEAESWWRLLVPPAGVKPDAKDDLAYPDPRGDRALIRAKQFLARLFRGPDESWRT